MSSKSKEKVKNILKRLSLELLGHESIPDLAKEMGYTKQTLYGWADNGKIPNKSVKKKIPNINPNFLKTGQGEPLLGDDAKKAIDSVDLLKSLASQYLDAKPTRDNLLQSLELAERLVQLSLRIARKLHFDPDES